MKMLKNVPGTNDNCDSDESDDKSDNGSSNAVFPLEPTGW